MQEIQGIGGQKNALVTFLQISKRVHPLGPKDQSKGCPRSNWALNSRGIRATSYYKKHAPSLHRLTSRHYSALSLSSPQTPRASQTLPHIHWVLPVFHSTTSSTFTLDDFNVHVHHIFNLWSLHPLLSSLKITSIYPCWPLAFVLPWNDSTLIS